MFQNTCSRRCHFQLKRRTEFRTAPASSAPPPGSSAAGPRRARRPPGTSASCSGALHAPSRRSTASEPSAPPGRSAPSGQPGALPGEPRSQLLTRLPPPLRLPRGGCPLPWRRASGPPSPPGSGTRPRSRSAERRGGSARQRGGADRCPSVPRWGGAAAGRSPGGGTAGRTGTPGGALHAQRPAPDAPRGATRPAPGDRVARRCRPVRAGWAAGARAARATPP